MKSNYTTFLPHYYSAMANLTFGQCVRKINVSLARNATFIMRRVDRTYRLWPLQGWLCVAAVLFVAVFLVTIVRAMYLKRVSRRFYALMLNRVVCDGICSICILITTYVDVEGTSWGTVPLVWLVGMYAAMVTYISLAAMRLYGVARPLEYARGGGISIRSCVCIIVSSWIFFFAAMVATAVVLYAVFSAALGPVETQSAKQRDVIAKLFARVMISIPVWIYVLTIGFFFLTVFYLLRARKSVNRPSGRPAIAPNPVKVSFSSSSTLPVIHRMHQKRMQRRFHIPIAKLSVNVANLAIFHLPFTLWCLYMAVLDFDFHERISFCWILLHLHASQLMDALIICSMVMRIIVDVLIGLATDVELHKPYSTRWDGEMNGPFTATRKITVTTIRSVQ